MEGLGFKFNVVPIAAGVALSMKNCSGISFLCTGNDTFTLTVSDAFAGSYATPGNILTRKVTSTATNGTAAWVEATMSASNAVTIASGAVVIYVASAMLPDDKTYIKCSAGASGLVTAIAHDLVVQRKPSNLAALSA